MRGQLLDLFGDVFEIGFGLVGDAVVDAVEDVEYGESAESSEEEEEEVAGCAGGAGGDRGTWTWTSRCRWR